MSAFPDAALLALHREIVAVPSVSGQEGLLVEQLLRWLAEHGAAAERIGDNLVAHFGEPPYLCLNSHLDTVPPSPGWTRPPHEVTVIDGRVHGLGANDAKASVAAMIAAFLRLAARVDAAAGGVLLTLVAQEEVGGRGTEALLPELRRRGLLPAAAVIGEPTALGVAIAQKGLLVLELHAAGDACHAAHGRTLGARNAIRALARDLVAIEGVDLGAEHPLLGPPTLEPTIIKGGTARNAVPAEASCLIDARINPEPGPAEAADRVRRAVGGELRVVSDRLQPVEIDAAHPLVRAALRAHPGAATFGSRGVSDWVFFGAAGIPAIKCGPGITERSHTADEFVLESEIVEGALFYERLALAWREEGMG